MPSIRDASLLVRELAGVVKGHVAAAFGPLAQRVKALEERQPERGEKGEPGRDAEPVDLEGLADAVVAKLLASDRVATLVDLAATKAVADYFEANPVKHGRDGKDGEPGPRGEKGEPGARGEDGKDGVGLAGALIDRDGALVLTMTDGRAKTLGVVVGRDGADGKNGRDGIGFDKCVGHFDAERGYVLTFSAGDTSTEHVLPYMRHGGFWSEGKGAKAGESWTHDGALWIAKRDNGSKPCLENKEDWILAARKGRDGKDGRNGIDLTASVKVG
jgi:hypothetical protein